MVLTNGIKKKFVLDTGSPVLIMPPDEHDQKITNRYEYVDKNQVNLRWKKTVDIKNKNNNQKNEI